MYVSKNLCELLSPFPLKALLTPTPPPKKGQVSLHILLEPNEPKLDFDSLYSKVLAIPLKYVKVTGKFRKLSERFLL